MTLIDKDALVAEIKKLIDEIYAGRPFDSLSSEQQTALWYVKSIMSSVNTLEVEEWKEEPASDELEDAARKYAVERYRATGDMVLAEKCKWSFQTGAEWQFERVKEALLSEVLPCFMHGGEADEVVTKLDEVLNQNK